MRTTLFALLAALALVAAGKETEFLAGEVLIRNDGPRTVIAFVQPEGGGTPREMRVVSEEPFPEGTIAYHFDRAEVFFEEGRISILDTAGRAAVVFAVRDYASRPRVDRVRDRVPSFTRYAPENVIALRGFEVGDRTVTADR